MILVFRVRLVKEIGCLVVGLEGTLLLLIEDAILRLWLSESQRPFIHASHLEGFKHTSDL